MVDDSTCQLIAAASRQRTWSTRPDGFIRVVSVDRRRVAAADAPSPPQFMPCKFRCQLIAAASRQRTFELAHFLPRRWVSVDRRRVAAADR